MAKGLHWLASFCVISVVSSPAFAIDLVQVYTQAIKSDPVFAQAQSNWESQKMQLPIAEAGYLPQITALGNADRVRTVYSPEVSTNVTSNTWQYGYSLSLTQPIFDYNQWTTIRGAQASVKSATATYIAAQQSLMQRTATAYFNVLEAYDQLRYTIANKRAVWQQFVTAREQFKVGLIAVTDEYDAHSQYDQVVAQQIVAQNNLNDQLENLRAITGRFYGSLKGLSDELPLSTPAPNNIDQWVGVAAKQNYSLIAQAYNVNAAMEAIKQQAGNGYPVLDLQGSYADARTSDNPPASGNPPQSGLATRMLGLQLTYKPLQGGLVLASIKQARYNYVAAAGLLEQTYRGVVNDTRTSFLGVLSSISQVNADKQRIISAKNAFEATEAGFKVGTRTMVDVLISLTTLYRAQQQYANDRYAYVDNLIALKAAAGTLSVNDLQAINIWLKQEITFPAQLSVSRVPDEEMTQEYSIGDMKKMSNTVTPEKAAPKPQQQTQKKSTMTAHHHKQLKLQQLKLPTPVTTAQNQKQIAAVIALPMPTATTNHLSEPRV